MSDSIEGIFLSKRKHTGGSLIVTILSENGLMSFYFRGGEKKAQHLFPMAYGTIIYQQNARSELHNMSAFELKEYHQYIEDPRRVAIAFFTAELLMKCTAEHNPDVYLFERTKDLIVALNERSPKSLPLYVLLWLTDPLGIRIDVENNDDDHQVFDLNEGRIGGGIATNQKAGGVVVELIKSYLNSDNERNYDRSIYRQAVSLMLHYYAEHYPGVARMKSVEVLYETMA